MADARLKSRPHVTQILKRFRARSRGDYFDITKSKTHASMSPTLIMPYEQAVVSLGAT